MTTPSEPGKYLEDFDVHDVDSILDPDGKLLAVVYVGVPVDMSTHDFAHLLMGIAENILDNSDFGATELSDGYQVASGLLFKPDPDDESQLSVVLPYAVQSIDASVMVDDDPWLALSMAHKRISELIGQPVTVKPDEESI